MKKFTAGKLLSSIDGFKGGGADEFKRQLLEGMTRIINRKRNDREEGVETIK